MTRILALSLLWTVAVESPAQEWARKMFNTTSHDFGTVARGSKPEFAFQITNPYKEDVHIASVRSSCGCTSPTVIKDTLKTHETGKIVTAFNTKSFVGDKSATITVTIDRPYAAEVQLEISGHIRTDVVFTPRTVDFGSVESTAGAEAKVDITYVGPENWRIFDVRSNNQFLEVDLRETQRGEGRVRYRMTVYLRAGAPGGLLQDELTVIDDETGAANLTLPIEGQISSPLSVSPTTLFLGELKPGDSVKKRLVVRSSKPFKITGIKCENPKFKFDTPPNESKTLHFVGVEYVAGTDAGKISQSIKFETDLDGLTAECSAKATVMP